MDTWWLRTFAVSVWQGITAWVGHKIEVGFPSVSVDRKLYGVAPFVFFCKYLGDGAGTL